MTTKKGETKKRKMTGDVRERKRDRFPHRLVCCYRHQETSIDTDGLNSTFDLETARSICYFSTPTRVCYAPKHASQLV